MIQDSLWLIVGSIVLVMLLIIFPVLNILEQQDELIQIRLMDETDYFIRQIKSQGKLTKSMYETYNAKLATLGNSFEVEIERRVRHFVPVYDDPTDTSSFNGEVAAVYDLTTNSEIIEELYNSTNTSHAYFFNRGDYIVVKVQSKLKSRATKLRDMLWRINTTTPTFFMRLSGMVLHEAN